MTKTYLIKYRVPRTFSFDGGSVWAWDRRTLEFTAEADEFNRRVEELENGKGQWYGQHFHAA